MFASPLFVLGSAVATVWAALFHLLFGRGWLDLALYWFVGLIGFAVGQTMAEALNLQWVLIGQMHVIEATLACWLAMFVAHWLKV